MLLSSSLSVVWIYRQAVLSAGTTLWHLQHVIDSVSSLRPAVGHVTFQQELWQFKVFRMFLLDLSLVPVENVQDVHRTRGIRARRCARRENPPEKRARRLWIIRK